MIELDEFYITCRGRKGLYWFQISSPAFLVEHDEFKTVVVHQILQVGVAGFDSSTSDWVATEARTGLAITVGKDKHAVANAAIKQLETMGVRQFEKQVAKQIKKLPPPVNRLPEEKA